MPLNLLKFNKDLLSTYPGPGTAMNKTKKVSELIKHLLYWPEVILITDVNTEFKHNFVISFSTYRYLCCF